MDREAILNYIQNARENSCVDFKRDFYLGLKNSDLPKDVSAFANYVNNEDKYIIFGVEDKKHQIVGISPETLISQDDIDAYLERTVEPFPEVVCGVEKYDEKIIGYIKITSKNTNPPYVIKETCGKNNKLEKGDIFIRKGSCNMKASRADIDEMYMKNGNFMVRIRENFAVVKPIQIENDIVKEQTYGHIDIELYNDTTRPLLIDGGNIEISLGDYSISRPIWSIIPVKNIRDYPLELPAQSRKVYTMLFDFLSQDCVDFGFDIDGRMDSPVKIRVKLFDTDNNSYESDEVTTLLIAKGDILHKVRLKHRDERKEEVSLKDLFVNFLKR